MSNDILTLQTKIQATSESVDTIRISKELALSALKAMMLQDELRALMKEYDK